MAESFLSQCIYQINLDSDPISRGCATSVVHAIKKDTTFLSEFFDTFRSTTSKGHGWRVERSIRHLINDKDVQKDQRYIEYLHQRKAGIEKWKKEHRAQKSS